MMDPTPLLEYDKILLTLFEVWIMYLVVKMLYNISPLHPLSAVPGPKLAAASYLPEFWFDVVLFGRYTKQISKMHEKFGPIVRINPDQVHCNDPKFIDEIFPVGARRRNKPSHQVASTQVPLSGFGTTDHDVHRARRAPSAKFFTRPMVLERFQGQVAAQAQQLCDKLLATRGQDDPVNLAIVYSNLATDIVSGACFGESFGLLDQPGFETNFSEPTRAGLHTQFIFRFFPPTRRLVHLLAWFVDYMPKNMALMIRTMQINLPKRIQKTIDDRDAGIIYEPTTVVESLLSSDLSPEDKSPERMVHEIFIIVGAGTETTAWALTVATYHLLTDPPMLNKLTKELLTVVEDPRHLPPLTTLEKLPYLECVIQEALRLSYGVAERTAREPVDEDLLYEGEWDKKPIRYLIPRGYAIGMSSVITNHDETLFPDSHKFRPERWLDPGNRRELDRALLAFGRGSRMCLGRHLALCELNIGLTALTLRVLPHMRLYETTEEDVRYDHDMLIPMTKDGSKGVRAIMV